MVQKAAAFIKIEQDHFQDKLAEQSLQKKTTQAAAGLLSVGEYLRLDRKASSGSLRMDKAGIDSSLRRSQIVDVDLLMGPLKESTPEGRAHLHFIFREYRRLIRAGKERNNSYYFVSAYPRRRKAFELLNAPLEKFASVGSKYAFTIDADFTRSKAARERLRDLLSAAGFSQDRIVLITGQFTPSLVDTGHGPGERGMVPVAMLDKASDILIRLDLSRGFVEDAVQSFFHDATGLPADRITAANLSRLRVYESGFNYFEFRIRSVLVDIGAFLEAERKIIHSTLAAA